MMPDARESQHRNVRQDLEWFLIHLDDQLDDWDLETKGVQLDLFWDASEVRRAVLGAFYFFDPIDFNKKQFEDDRTMVASLAAQRWLGSIKMLEPHQAEFAKALRVNFNKTQPWLTGKQVETFFREVELPESEEFSLATLGSRTVEQRAVLVSKYAGQAGRLFKAIQCAKGSWRDRLSLMYKNDILRFEPSSSIDYGTIFSSAEFHKLKSFLDERRPDKKDNNLADAVCLCLLRQQVAEFRTKGTKRLPRFYETTSLFRDALTATDLLDSVSYSDDNGDWKTVLRGSDYFVFRAAFSVRDERVDSPFANVSKDDLKEVRDRIDTILKAAAPLQPDELEEIAVNGKRINAVIRDLKRFWILESIWLPFIASEELKVIDDEAERSRLQGFRPDQHLASLVDKAIEGVTRALDENVAQYNLFSKIWKGIEEHRPILRSRYEPIHAEPEKLYQMSAVGRFGIPEQSKADIDSMLRGLILGDEEDQRRESTRLAKLCISAKTERDPQSRTIAAAALWVLEFYSAIQDLGIANAEESWLLAMAAASHLKTYRAPDARRGIRELEARFVSGKYDQQKMALAMALAYLYFHLWRIEGGKFTWRADRFVKTDRTPAELQHIVDDSIRFAATAYEAAVPDTSAHVYALNIFLYYITEAGTDIQFQKASRLADELLPWHTFPTIWQYRFDDTMARYFHRKSLRMSDPEIRKDLLRIAKSHIDAAIAGSPGDPDVAYYRSTFLNTITDSNE
jgi:hypothetical protein